MNYDDLLHISTEEEHHQFPVITHYHRYEPTAYNDLVMLAEAIRPLLHHNEQLVDFGSGLMRVPIFMNYLLPIHTLGIELNKALYMDGMKNVESYQQHHQSHYDIRSLNVNVTDYQFTGSESILFFFNPFSADIFKSVLYQFLTHTSYKHRVLVILYYAKVEYIDAIHQLNIFNEIKRIPLAQYPDDENDMIIIYQLG